MPNKRIVGIDFGTSATVIRIKTYDGAGKPLDDNVFTQSVTFDQKNTVPTIICKTDSGEYLCGEEVSRRSENGEIYTNFKIDLISRDAEKRERANQLVSEFFKHLYNAYKEQEYHFPPCTNENTRTHISYPAKWPENLRRIMMRLAEDAGFKNVSGYDEPTAALHAVMTQEVETIQKNKRMQPGQSAYILMADLGAGTTDLALCKYSFGKSTKPHIFATWPMADNHVLFGGREIDKGLCEYLKKHLQNCGVKEKERAKLSSPIMMNNTKTWKETHVSPELRECSHSAEPAFLETYASTLPMDTMDFPCIDRKVFEDRNKEYINMFPQLVNEFMKEAKGKEGFSGADDVDFVILTGGHCQWYFLDDMFLGRPLTIKTDTIRFPKIQREPDRLMRLARPQETVALGLVYMPMHVSIKTCMANSIWMCFDVDGKKTDAVKVIDYGTVLPYEKSFTSSVTQEQGVLDRDISVTCVKYVGQSLGSAMKDFTTIKIEKTSFVALDLFKRIFASTDTKTITLDYTIKVDENQISRIDVTVSAEGFKSIHFTF